MILYKGKSKTTIPASWITGGPTGAVYGTTDSGWMTEQSFYEWMSDFFLPHIDEQSDGRPYLLLLDGHASHVSLRVRELAEAHNVFLFLLLPHSSHLCQPLDVAVFGPMKVSSKLFHQ